MALSDANSWPPGFRFHPTDEELVLYYLKRKICGMRLKIDIIAETDVYKWDPEELPGQSKLKSGDRQWFFFSPRDRKYPNGARSNRATRYGYWKATGKDRIITCNNRSVGVKKTLVYYKGRAPAGERTDWVMHEYTLDEEELKRCLAPQDYFALYKVFKKSGPGPKNGEQYGAPFNEEEWPDDVDERSNVDNNVLLENSVKRVKDVESVDNIRANGQVGSPLNDLEEFMSRFVDEPVHVQPLATDYAYALPEVGGDEETRSTVVDSSLGEPSLHQRSIVLQPRSQQFDVQTSFDLTQLATSQLPISEVPEVTSTSIISGQQFHMAKEDFLGDYLEMDDLMGPEPGVREVQNPVENLELEEFDGLFEFDLYHDAPMFLHDGGPVNPAPVLDPCLNNFQNGMVSPASYSHLINLDNGMGNPASHSYPNNLEHGLVNPVSHSYPNNLEYGMLNPVSHSYPNNLDNDLVNQLDYLLQHDSNDAHRSSSPLWTLDQRRSVFTPAETNQMTIPEHVSGVVCSGYSASLPPASNQNQNYNQNPNQSDKDDGTDSWFSSTLWSFVESIPTAPASASENALVNKAFDRMSSFRRLRINGLNTNVATPGNPTVVAAERISGKYNRGFFCFSVLGVVCALLWIVIGTSVKILGRFISS